MRIEKLYYRLDELAALWGTHVNTIRNMIKDGRLQAFKVGALWRVSHDERLRIERKNTNGHNG